MAARRQRGVLTGYFGLSYVCNIAVCVCVFPNKTIKRVCVSPIMLMAIFAPSQLVQSLFVNFFFFFFTDWQIPDLAFYE